MHGLKHLDVLPLLKDLPIEVQLVCARPKSLPINTSIVSIETSANNQKNPFQQISSTSPPKQQQLLEPTKNDNLMSEQNYSESNIQPSFIDRLVKAKSDGSLAISPIASITPTTGMPTELSKLRSRSLEPLSGLAMWNNEPQIIKLIKGDRGLGFSILDYQVEIQINISILIQIIFFIGSNESE